MIILKLAFIVALCYILCKGMTSEYQNQLELEKNKVKDTKDAAKAAYQKMQAEKQILTNTINELREELSVIKNLKGK